MLLSPETLMRQRTRQERQMTGTVQILENAAGEGGSSDIGGDVWDWQPLPQSYPCRVVSNEQLRHTEFGGSDEQVLGSHTIVMPWDAPLERHHRLRTSGMDFRIIGDNAEHTDRLSLHVSCDRVET